MSRSPLADDDMPARYRNLVREAARVMTATSEDVGARFPEEARKIHYREVEQRAIRGTASLDEVARAGGGGRRDHGAAPAPRGHELDLPAQSCANTTTV